MQVLKSAGSSSGTQTSLEGDVDTPHVLAGTTSKGVFTIGAGHTRHADGACVVPASQPRMSRPPLTAPLAHLPLLNRVAIRDQR